MITNQTGEPRWFVSVCCIRADWAKDQWMTLFHQTWVKQTVLNMQVKRGWTVNWWVGLVFWGAAQWAQQDFHLPANLMTWSQYGPCSKPPSWKQLYLSVARRWSVLVMVAAKELKDVLTEDWELPNSAGRESAEKNQEPIKAAAEMIDNDVWKLIYQW